MANATVTHGETRILLDLSIEEAIWLRRDAAKSGTWGEQPGQDVYDTLDDALVEAGETSTYVGGPRPWRQ